MGWFSNGINSNCSGECAKGQKLLVNGFISSNTDFHELLQDMQNFIIDDVKGFNWGGTWSSYDGMHIQINKNGLGDIKIPYNYNFY